ncbi:hypothetical protein JQC91_09140 [Jannaschia sp. Os4]|nr:hypothetical protein [Jannaschia sp. Os4]MBM2576471.1 hypothetical protein [Jannaschia sp. Os4]
MDHQPRRPRTARDFVTAGAILALLVLGGVFASESAFGTTAPTVRIDMR